MDDGTIKDYKVAMRDYLFGKKMPKIDRNMPKEEKLFLFFEKMWKVAEEENEQLKAQLEKTKCCGSCKWWRWWDWYDQMQCCDCKDSEWYQKSVCPDNKCKKWEVQK